MIKNIGYYMEYINLGRSNKEKAIELGEQYSEQLSKGITKFSILINSNKAEIIKLNGIEYKALVDYRRVKEPILNSLVRNIEINQGIIKYGDYVEYKDGNSGNTDIYLIKSKVQILEDSDSAYMQVCNNALRLKAKINNKEEIIEIPCIICDGTYSIEEFKNISIPNNHLECEVGYSLANKLKYINDSDNPTRFIINGRAFKVAAQINNITKMIGNQGLYIIKLESCAKMPEDDIELGIAFNSTENINANENKPTESTNPTDKPKDPVNSTTPIYSIQGSDILDSKTIQDYTIVDQNNILVIDKAFKFSFEKADYNTPSSLFFTKGMTSNSIKFLGSKQVGEFILKGICKTDENILVKKNIKVIV